MAGKYAHVMCVSVFVGLYHIVLMSSYRQGGAGGGNSSGMSYICPI